MITTVVLPAGLVPAGPRRAVGATLPRYNITCALDAATAAPQRLIVTATMAPRNSGVDSPEVRQAVLIENRNETTVAVGEAARPRRDDNYVRANPGRRTTPGHTYRNFYPPSRAPHEFRYS